MKMRTFMTALVIASATVAANGAARSADRDRQAVDAIEREWLAGLHDRVTLERVLAEDFVHVVDAGVFLTKPEHIEWAVSHPGPAGRHQQFERLTIRPYGNTAVATGMVRTDDPGAATSRSVFTDVFVRRRGRWQAVSAQETPVQPR